MLTCPLLSCLLVGEQKLWWQRSNCLWEGRKSLAETSPSFVECADVCFLSFRTGCVLEPNEAREETGFSIHHCGPAENTNRAQSRTANSHSLRGIQGYCVLQRAFASRRKVELWKTELWQRADGAALQSMYSKGSLGFKVSFSMNPYDPCSWKDRSKPCTIHSYSIQREMSTEKLSIEQVSLLGKFLARNSSVTNNWGTFYS